MGFVCRASFDGEWLQVLSFACWYRFDGGVDICVLCQLTAIFQPHASAYCPYPPPPFPQELRRGVDRAVIYSLCFNASSQYVACSSDKGTVHVFSIGEVRMAASLLCMCVCVIVMFTMQC